ncbi:unnamed protein product [Brassica oleracea]
MYDHEEATKDKKRKPYRGPSREQEGPALKQRRLSRFFSRKVPGRGHDVAELQAKVEKLSKGFASLEKVRREVWRGGTRRKKLFDGSPPVGSDCSSDEDGDDRMKDTAPLQDGPGLEGMEPELVADPSGKKEQDVVPLEAVYTGGVDKEGTMIFFGSGSNTFYVTEDEVLNNKALCGEGVVANEVECEDQASGKEPESKEKTAAEEKGDVGEMEVEKEKDEAVEEEADMEGRLKEKEDGALQGVEDVGGSEGLVNVADEEKGDVAGTTCEVAAADGVEGGNEDESAEDKMLAREETMVELSDSSPSPRSEKHKPVEQEADLAALLLAKERFTMDKLVPEVEDPDYAFFESVLVVNPKV